MSTETLRRPNVVDSEQVVDPHTHLINIDGLMTEEDIKEFSQLEGDESERGTTHRKAMLKAGIAPVPPRDWLVCPICEKEIAKNGETVKGLKKPYRAPQSLVNHMRDHGGINKAAADWNLLPEQIKIVNTDLQQRFKAAGQASSAKTKAMKTSV